MFDIPRLRGIPESDVLYAKLLRGGLWLFKLKGKKGPGDFRVVVYDADKRRRLTPAYAHFAIDLFGKLSSSRTLTMEILKSIEQVYSGAPAEEVLTKLKIKGETQEWKRLPGYSVEYVLSVLELIFEQENVNWNRDMAGKPIPDLRRALIRSRKLTEDEAKVGSALAMHLLRRVVRDGEHPVGALQEVGLRIARGYG